MPVATLEFCHGILRSQLPHEGHKVGFLVRRESQLKDQVEEFNRIFQGQASPIMHVRRAVLDAAERECLHRAH